MIETLLGSQFLVICLYISCAICCAGTLLRLVTWFTRDIGPKSDLVPVWKRITGTMSGIVKTIFSFSFFRILKALILDVILQSRILKTSMVRWFMHILIFFGFMGLILMHALDEMITSKIMSGYYATLDPYQFLRNFFGLMVFTGIGIALYRRIRYRSPVLNTGLQDRFIIAAIAIIILTGFILESAKIISGPVFERMATEFMAPEKPSETVPLKIYWRDTYGTVFTNLDVAVTPQLLSQGKEMNDNFCSSCHSPLRSAFISRPLAKGLSSVGAILNRSRADIWIFYIHVFCCFIALAMLPFTRLFHIITNPLLLIINSVSDKEASNPASALPRRALELDTCTNCGTCSKYCSVLPVFTVLGNDQVLPARKLQMIGKLNAGTSLDRKALMVISEGAFTCTSCMKCTTVCPSGINLQDHWLAQKSFMREKGHPPPHIWIKDHTASEWSDRIKIDRAFEITIHEAEDRFYDFTHDSEIFEPCIQCQTCTNVCPVVAANPDPANAIDITPQKIMNFLRLGLRNFALGTRMVWDCTTCYQCQENCPQGINVTEIIYELKNLAYERFKHIEWQNNFEKSRNGHHKD